MAVVIRPPFWVPRPSDDFIAPIVLMPTMASALYLTPRATIPTKAPFFIPRPSDDFISPISLLSPPAATPYLVSTIKVSVQTLAPMYVPRPWDDYPWAPIAETLNVSQSLLTKPAPRKPRQWVFGYDDASHYLIAQPQQAVTLQILTLGGKPPFRRWASYELYFDDASLWQGNPVRSWIISELTQSPMPLSPFYTMRPSDDPAWAVTPDNLNVPASISVKGPNPFAPDILRFYGYDDASVWLGSPLSSYTLHPLLTAAGQTTIRRWPVYTIDDPAVWSGSPLASETLIPDLVSKPFHTVWSWYQQDDATVWQRTTYRNMVELAVPFVPLTGRFYGYDDPAVWSGSPLNAKLIRDLTAAGQPPTKVYSFYPSDDASTWQATIYRSLGMATLTPEPTIAKISRFVSYDDPAVWSGSPLNADTLYMLVEKGPPFFKAWSPYSLTQDDASPWQRTVVRNMPALVTPFVPDIWRFNSLDDPAVWSGSPLNTDTLFMLVEKGPPFHTAWAPLTVLDDPAVWSGSPLNADSLFMLVEKGPPFFKSWSFNVNDDPAVWSGSPLNAKLIRELTAAGQPPTPKYSFYVWDDPPPWQSTIIRNLSTSLVTLEPYIPDITRFWSYDDPAVWSGSPLHSWIIPELTQQTPIIPDVGRFWSYDDAAFWLGSPVRSWIIPELTQQTPAIPDIGRFWSYDETAPWQETIYPNRVAATPQPAPTVPLIARFVTYDDAAFWLGTPVASNFLAVTPEEYIPTIARFESYDDPSVWSGSPLHSWLIPELTQGGQPPTLVFRFVSFDDASVWQATTYRNYSIGVPPPAPFVPLTERFVSYDDPAFWQGTPTASFTLPMFIRNGSPVIPDIFRFASYDDASFWAGAPVSAQTLSLLILGGSPGVPLVWRFNSLDDPPPWQIFPYRNFSIGFVIPPFLPRAWGFGQSGTFGMDDATTWNAAPVASATIVQLTAGGRPFSVPYATGAVQGNYDVAESAWAFQAPFNLATASVMIPPPTFSNQSTFFVMSAFAFGYDSGQGQWNWAPPLAWSQVIPIPPPVVGIFTVSGPEVVDLFDPVTGVTYTWSPTQRRTA